MEKNGIYKLSRNCISYGLCLIFFSLILFFLFFFLKKENPDPARIEILLVNNSHYNSTTFRLKENKTACQNGLSKVQP